MQRGNSAASRDIAYHLHPYTHLKKHESEGPLVITKGKGIYVYDDAGKEYIEGLAGLWCTSLGFSENRLVEAATRLLVDIRGMRREDIHADAFYSEAEKRALATPVAAAIF